MMTLQDISNNLWQAIGIGIGSVSGIAIALINTKKKENKELEDLKKNLEDLSIKFDSLKTAFTLVFDEMERKGDLPEQLKDFKKIFNL